MSNVLMGTYSALCDFMDSHRLEVERSFYPECLSPRLHLPWSVWDYNYIVCVIWCFVLRELVKVIIHICLFFSPLFQNIYMFPSAENVSIVQRGVQTGSARLNLTVNQFDHRGFLLLANETANG